MIEPNLVKWLDLGDNMQKSDIYMKGSFLVLFRFFRTMLQHKNGNIILFIILKIVFFLQVMMIPIINNPSKDSDQDSLIQFLHYIKQIIFIQDLISKKSDYIIFLTIGFILIAILYILIIYILINSKGKIQETPVKLLNVLNIFVQNYLMCPIVNVFMLSIKCEKSKHIYFKYKCFDDYIHILIVFFSLLSLFSCLIYSFLLSLFYYQVGGIKTQDLLKRVNCNFEFYVNFLSMIYYFISFYLQYYTKESQTSYSLYNRFFFFLFTLFLFLYMYFNVFYYDRRINAINLYGWGFLWWYSVGLLLKKSFKIKDISIFVIVGMVCICFILFFLDGYNTEYYLTQANILESKSIKQIEQFTYNLLDIVSQNTIKSKTLVSGIINSIEEFFKSQPEIYEKYENFIKNKIMISKLGGKSNILFNAYNIIYIIYDFYLEKAEMKENIMIIISYFLMNNLKNPTYAAFLTSTIKVNGIRILYLKYILVEDIKDFLIAKLIKNSANKESIKHIEIGSVIVYDNYIDSFKMKIYDAACNQIDYFDILKNNTLSSKATKNFLNIGDSILLLRKEINSLWNKIIKLNPFSDDIEKDYMLYLRTIIQDEDLAQKEEKRYYHIKMSKLSEKHNIYHSLFDKDVSTVILVDGCGLIGKIIYVTPNFGTIFNFLPKELVNVMITDFQPTYIAQFHKDIMFDALKYSNLNYMYPNMKNIVLKGKGNGLFNVNAYIKCLPNFDFGLIYILVIEKINDNQFIILLDENFYINAMTNPYVNVNGDFSSINNINNYNLNNNIINHHCAIIIPDILKFIKFDGERFCLLKNDIDLKGILYPNTEHCLEFTSLIENVLDRIKQTGQLIYEDNITPAKHTLINQLSSQTSVKLKKEQNLHEFHDLLNHIKEKCGNKSISIFYRITSKEFLNGSKFYFKIFITNDLMNGNDYNINISKNNNNIQQKSLQKSRNSTVLNNSPSNNDIHKLKGIKIKISQDKNKNDKDKKIKFNENTNENEENNNIERQLSQNSLTTKSSVDSASFNKLKSKILNKNEPNIITYMKLASFFFLVSTILLIYLNSNNAKNKLKFLEEYLDQNFYFNHTKIIISCVYSTSANLKLIKYKILNDSACITDGGCKIIYLELLSKCLNDIKIQTAKVPYFNDDYKEKLSINNNITIYMYNLTTTTNITLDGPNLLNFVLSNGIRFKNNINNYIEVADSEYQIYGENILKQGHYYINNNLIEGFNRELMSEKITQRKFSTNYIFIILNCIIFIGVMVILNYMTFKLYHIQKFFISKLVKFHSLNFDNYIKYLEELKKKLRNDSCDDEEKDDENQSNGNNNDGLHNTKSEEKEQNKKGKKESSYLRESNRNGGRKKMQGKMSKIQQQKQEKINIMSLYIFKFNLILALKICLLLILSMLYYLIVYILYFQKRREYFNFDDIINNIYGIYKDCDIIFANLLNEAIEYENFIIKRDKIISSFQKGDLININFNGIEYTINNYTVLSNLTYKIKVPDSTEILIPRVNNILLPIISNVKMDKKSSKSKIAQLFNGDICEIIFEKNITQYQICSNFWSSILKQGLIQCITQMSVEINTILDELEDVNMGTLSFYDFINKSTFSQLKTFINYYFLESFRKNDEYFNSMRKEKLNFLHKILNFLLVIFIIILIVLFIFLILMIYSAKTMFSSFLGFIGIIPIQYLFEDEFFYKDVLKLEEDIFD